jgi:hypothetical protein
MFYDSKSLAVFDGGNTKYSARKERKWKYLLQDYYNTTSVAQTIIIASVMIVLMDLVWFSE